MHPTQKAPGPVGFERLQILRQFKQEPLLTMLQVGQRYGDIICMSAGKSPAFIISHPDHVEKILPKSRQYHKQTPDNANTRVMLGRGILTAEGPLWVKHRKAVQPHFRNIIGDSYASNIVNATNQILEKWDCLNPNQEVDITQQMGYLLIEIIGQTFFSTDLHQQAPLLRRAINLMMDHINYLNNSSFVAMHWYQFVTSIANTKSKKALRVLNDFAFNLIQQRLSSKQSPVDFLNMLITADSPPLSHHEIRDEILTILFTGTETTLNALCWTFYLLSKHPDVLCTLQVELEKVLNGKAPQLSDVQKLVYTTRVLKESLRLFPPVWIIERSNYEETEIGGYAISKNSRLFIPSYLTHRRNDIWDNPEGFDPDRFTPEREAKLPRFAYYPFAYGPRQCIGKQFAIMQAVIILAMVLQRYDLRLVPGHPVTPLAGMIMRMKQGLKMTLKRL